MRVEAKETIAAAADRIFTFSQDYTKRVSWDPFLREARLIGNLPAGVGVRSWCVTWFGLGMETEYVSFQPPKTVAVKMTRGPWIFREFAASWNFHALDEAATEVRFVYAFRVRWPAWPAAPLILAVFRFEMRRRLEALKRASE